MYPLRFEPIFRHYLWGGQRLASELGKETGDQMTAESWEVVDREEANSVVSHGSLAGQTLGQILSKFGQQVLGASVFQDVNRSGLPEKLKGRFPLLLKFLDANKTLSVQVHPDDEAGMKKDVPDLGKTEAWVVMDAKPGSQIYGGLKSGVDRQGLADAMQAKQTDRVLHTFEPGKGDCVFVPAGTVHAIGEGLLIAEIQQCSDTTYRLFDWNRVGADGKERDLHVQQALEVTDYDRGPVNPQTPRKLDDPRVTELVRCDKFVIRRWTLNDEETQIATSDAFRLLMVTDGAVEIKDDPSSQPLRKGQTVLVPACLGSTSVNSDGPCEFLEIGPANA